MRFLDYLKPFKWVLSRIRGEYIGTINPTTIDIKSETETSKTGLEAIINDSDDNDNSAIQLEPKGKRIFNFDGINFGERVEVPIQNNTPAWYNDSMSKLKRWKIWPEERRSIASIASPEQLDKVYTKLHSILGPKTEPFMRLVTQVFYLQEDNFQKYAEKLNAVLNLAKKEYSSRELPMPRQFDWYLSPSRFTDLSRLSTIEGEIRKKSAITNDKGDYELRDMLHAYDGKKILFFGVSDNEETKKAFGEFLPKSELLFYGNKKYRKLSETRPQCDVIVLSSGVETQSFRKIIQDAYEESRTVRAWHTNHLKVLECMAQNAHRFT